MRVPLRSKRLIMFFLFWIVAIWGYIKRKKQTTFQNIVILFLAGGIGDLIMLSPVIERIKELFPDASVTLVTDKPDIVQWKGIRVVNKETFLKERHAVDLLIAPTLSLRYIPHLFFVKNWIGYFARPTVQANWRIPTYSYNPQVGHYLWRGVYLLQALNLEIGRRFEKEMQEKKVKYPQIIQKEPVFFSTVLQGKRYLVVGIFSKHADRQWGKEDFASVIADVTERQQLEKVVLIGDNSNNNQQAALKLIQLLSLPKEKIINLVGQNSLVKTAFIIARSALFLGVDSGPSHVAYLTAPRSLVIFVTVRPEDRLPLRQSSEQQVQTISPLRDGELPLYSGLSEVSGETAKIYVKKIKRNDVLAAIENLMR